jgi:hypothetical protein
MRHQIRAGEVTRTKRQAVSAVLPRASKLIGALTNDLTGAGRLSTGELAALLCQVGALQTVLSARFAQESALNINAEGPGEDQLQTVAETAERLRCSPDWLYRHHHRLGFAIRNGRQLRFSAHGLDRYIRARTGRERTSLSPDAERCV